MTQGRRGERYLKMRSEPSEMDVPLTPARADAKLHGEVLHVVGLGAPGVHLAGREREREGEIDTHINHSHAYCV